MEAVKLRVLRKVFKELFLFLFPVGANLSFVFPFRNGNVLHQECLLPMGKSFVTVKWLALQQNCQALELHSPTHFHHMDSAQWILTFIIIVFISDEVVQPVCLQIPNGISLQKHNEQDTYLEIASLRKITRKKQNTAFHA